jgi:hypothetical protein
MLIQMIEGPNGKQIPAQQIRTVYALFDDGRLGKAAATEGSARLFVSHFETCPKASTFSKGRKP